MSIIRHPIWQYAYFVEDIDEACRKWNQMVGAVRGRAIDAVDVGRRLGDAQGRVQGQRTRGTTLVAVGRHHLDRAELLETLMKHREATGTVAVVVTEKDLQLGADPHMANRDDTQSRWGA